MTANDAYAARLLKVLNHVQRHLDEAPTLRELAALAGYSPYHFHRLFSGALGEPVGLHLRRLRLERAAAQLRQGGTSVTEIAFDAGYDSLEGFSRAFRAWCGRSPSAYRRAPGGLPPARSGIHYAPHVRLAVLPHLWPETPMDVRIDTLAPMTVAYARRHGPYQQAAEAGFGAVYAWAAQSGVLPRVRGCVGASYDDPDVVPADQLTYDACLLIDGPFEPGGDVAAGELAGGRYAIFRYRGGYGGIHDAFLRLYGQWLPSSGEETDERPALEIYRNDPRDTPEAELLTDLCVPLKA